MNVLVYSGLGTNVESVRHCLYTLRRLLSHKYSISPVSGDVIVKEPWTTSCALLVIPGGGDLGYCKTLNGSGNRNISQFVRRGGAYLGFCAGAYYGSARCEFEVGDPKMEVSGSRELKFFPGTCRGSAFPGFQYDSNNGARAPLLKVDRSALGGAAIPAEFHCYHIGGGVFVDADNYKDNKVEVLAQFTEPLNVEGGDAAAVYVKVGEGHVILTSPHPEYAGVNLDPTSGGSDYPSIVDKVLADDSKRIAFMKACLSKLGLEVNETGIHIPALTRLHLTSINPEFITHLINNLDDLITKEGSSKIIVGENDTFVLEEPRGLSIEDLKLSENNVENQEEDKIIDYKNIRKHIYVNDKGYPSAHELPYFNHALFYQSLKDFRSQSRSSPSEFGSFLLYGEVVTSTSTMLDKNFRLLQKLPNGLTAVATTQIAGRGRGTNAWVSPMGCLVFSTCIRHPFKLNERAPVVFIEHLTALAIIEAIKQYDFGYQDMPVKLKWPNDIYAEDPTTPTPVETKSYVKIAGILINSNYIDNEFYLVVGCGINITNKLPTTSLNILLEEVNKKRRSRNQQPLPPYQPEKLLAKILVLLEEMYSQFCLSGFKPFEKQYYQNWMHSNQIVTLEMENGKKARIRGITLDHGLLIADEIEIEEQPKRRDYFINNHNQNNKQNEEEGDGIVRLTGRTFTLQSDGNSFDFMKGLLKKKR